MKLLAMLLTVSFSNFAFAEVIDSCQLSSTTPEYTQVEGTFTVQKNNQGLELVVQGKMTNDSGEIFDLADVRSVEVSNYNKDKLDEKAQVDANVSELMEALGDESASELNVYQTLGYDDYEEGDANGLKLYRLKGSGRIVGTGYIGWMSVHCN